MSGVRVYMHIVLGESRNFFRPRAGFWTERGGGRVEQNQVTTSDGVFRKSSTIRADATVVTPTLVQHDAHTRDCGTSNALYARHAAPHAGHGALSCFEI